MWRSFAVQAVALLRGGAGDVRIVGVEQPSPDSDEVAGRRPECLRRVGAHARIRTGASLCLAPGR